MPSTVSPTPANQSSTSSTISRVNAIRRRGSSFSFSHRQTNRVSHTQASVPSGGTPAPPPPPPMIHTVSPPRRVLQQSRYGVARRSRSPRGANTLRRRQSTQQSSSLRVRHAAAHRSTSSLIPLGRSRSFAVVPPPPPHTFMSRLSSQQEGPLPSSQQHHTTTITPVTTTSSSSRLMPQDSQNIRAEGQSAQSPTASTNDSSTNNGANLPMVTNATRNTPIAPRIILLGQHPAPAPQQRRRLSPHRFGTTTTTTSTSMTAVVTPRTTTAATIPVTTTTSTTTSTPPPQQPFYVSDDEIDSNDEEEIEEMFLRLQEEEDSLDDEDDIIEDDEEEDNEDDDPMLRLARHRRMQNQQLQGQYEFVRTMVQHLMGGVAGQNGGAGIGVNPALLALSLTDRDFTEADYELLLSLDENNPHKTVDETQIQNLERKHLSDKEAIEEMRCSICLEEYAAGDEVTVLPSCHHCYHPHCINQWLEKFSNDCPVCKKTITEVPPRSSSYIPVKRKRTSVVNLVDDSDEEQANFQPQRKKRRRG